MCRKEHNGVTKTCERCKEYARKYHIENAEKRKKYLELNSEKIKKQVYDYYVQHAEEIKKKNNNYYAQNAEQIKEQVRDYRATVHGMFLHTKRGARDRGINFEITEDFVGHLTDQNCRYCGTETTTTCRNGIDRLDNAIGYIETNVVSCCGTCNSMKKCLDPRTFVERCTQVSLHNGFAGAMCEFWNDIKGYSFADYKRTMKSRGKNFQLTKEQYELLRQENCTYCGRSCTDTHTNGIDCVDSSHGYVIDNCVSCCGDCNYAKRSQSANDFIKKCVTIASKTHVFPDIPRCVKMICQNRPKI